MEKISEESLAILLLTSDLLYRKTKDKFQKPFTAAEWNRFASILRNSPYVTPAALLGKNEENLMKDLLVQRTVAEKVCHLMKYTASMAIEVERLSGLGIWIATRGDKNYPQRVKHYAHLFFMVSEMEITYARERLDLSVLGMRIQIASISQNV